MRTSNAMQLKALINARAKKSGIMPQRVLQGYLLERIMERVSLSHWRDCIVIKGGVLISSLIGADKRSTKDLDATVKGFPLTHENAEMAFKEIATIDANDGFSFEFVRTEDIREEDDYPGIRIHLEAHYESIESPVTIDVTTGDKITPEAIEYKYPLLFEDRTIALMAYPIQTILAEKLETVISRNIANTRMRDYYDIHMLWHSRGDEIDRDVLRAAFVATAEKRGSSSEMAHYRTALNRVIENGEMAQRWDRYAKQYSYVGDLTLAQTCETAIQIMSYIF